MLHGAGILTYIWLIFWVDVGKHSSTMERLASDIGSIDSGELRIQHPHDALSDSFATRLPQEQTLRCLLKRGNGFHHFFLYLGHI